MKERLHFLFRISLVAGVCLFLAGCGQTTLYSDLEEKEVNEMMSVLLSRGISASKIAGSEEGMWTVNVEQSRLPDAVEILNHFGYPKDDFQTIGDVFQKTGLVSSPTEERIRFMYALSQTIAETLTQIDGVLVARVHVVLQDNDPLKEIVEPASAAVFIKYRRGSGVDALSTQIKKLVTNSIEGLVYEKVSIALFPASLSEIQLYGTEGEVHPGESPHVFPLRLVLIIAMVVIVLLVLVGVGAYWYWQNKKSSTSSPPHEAS